MKKSNIVIIALLSLFLTACFSDEGNYTYKKLNDIVVECKQRVYVVVGGEEILLEPLLKYSGAEDGDTRPLPEVTYEWVINNEVVSTDDKFMYTADIKVEQIEALLKVRVVETGEQYAGHFTISVESAFKTGYLILYEKDFGVGELGFIRGIKNKNNGIDTLIFSSEYDGIYERVNGFSMLNNPVSIAEFSPSPVNNDQLSTAVTLVTDNGNFIENLNGESLARETSLQNEFVSGKFPEGFSPKQVIHTPVDAYLLAKDNLLYPKRSLDREQLFTGQYNASYVYNDGAKYSDILSTDIKQSSTLLALEYDEDGKRNYVGILCVDSSNQKYNGRVLPVISNENAELLKDFQDVKGEIISYDYNLYGYPEGNILALSVLMKENGEYILHNFVMDYISRQNLSVKSSKIIHLKDVTDGKPILGMSTSKIKDHVLFYDENKIYLYDIVLNQTTVLFSSPSKKISAVGLYGRITDYYNSLDGIKSVDSSFAIGYETGEVDIYELKRPDLKELGDKIFTSKNNYGKIKQISYILGTSGAFYDEIY